MASILNDEIVVNPTLEEIHVPITVVFMAYEAYEYLHTANWPDYIRCLLDTTTKQPSIKEFQRYTHNIEDYLRNQILNFHIDTIRDELDVFIRTIFKDVSISSIPGQDGIYYFYNSMGKLILMIAVICPGGSK